MKPNQLKKLTFVLFCFITQFGFGQNWELFPHEQKSYYSKGAITESFNYVVVDSVKDYGISTTFTFNPWENYAIPDDCIEAVEFAIEYPLIYCTEDSVDKFPFIDSISLHNDTAFIFSDLITYDFYFLPHSLPGDEWNILPAGYEDIVIRCIGIDEEIVFGITDSVKTFEFIDPGFGTIDGKTIRISKNFGLLEYIDFKFLAQYAGGGIPPIYYFQGFTKDVIKQGFYLPAYDEYFVYDSGDLLIWKRNVSNTVPFDYVNYFEYYRDSITSKSIYPDSIVFIFDRIKKDTLGILTTQDELKAVYKESGFDPLLLSPDGFISVAGNQFALYGDETIWCNSNLDIMIDADTSIIRNFYSNENVFYYLPDCMVGVTFDVGWNLQMQTGIGVTSRAYSINKSSDSWDLIGYNINGEVFGDIDIYGVDIANDFPDKIQLNPNPSHDLINVNCENCFYLIYDCNGIIVMSGNSLQTTISIQNLNPGIYFIKVQTKNEVMTGKFVKI